MHLHIDVGNDASTLAFAAGNNTSRQQNTLYSYVSSAYIDPKVGKWLVGKEAEKRGMNDPLHYFRSFPRNLEDNKAYIVGSSIYPVQTLIAALLWRMKYDALMGNLLTSGVVIVPPVYKERHNALIRQAGLEADYAQLEVLESPIAVAAYYGSINQLSDGETLLIYDLGDMFNCSIIQKQNVRYVRLGQAIHSEQHGGKAFDNLIYQRLIHLLAKKHPDLDGLLDQSNKTKDALVLRFMLQDFCKSLKHQLSERNEVQGVIPAEVPLVAGEVFPLTRQEFETMIAPLFDETIHYCNMLVSNLVGGWQAISKVLLVGKSCFTPFVVQQLEQRLQRPVQPLYHIPAVACLGAMSYYRGIADIDVTALFNTLLSFITNAPLPGAQLQIVPLLTYQQAIEYFVQKRPGDPRVQKGAMLREPHRRGYVFTQIFLDKYNGPVSGPDGNLYARQLLVERFDADLRDTFADKQLVLVE